MIGEGYCNRDSLQKELGMSTTLYFNSSSQDLGNLQTKYVTLMDHRQNTVVAKFNMEGSANFS